MRIALKELLTFIILVSSTTIRRTVAAVPQKQSSNHAAREEEQKVPGGDKHRDKAIIVGGGPVGLASAIMLANRGYDVSIFEATTADEINTFNPSSAYLYNINTRGQTFTKVFPKLHKKLVERSVGSMEVRFMIVPGDTSKKIIYPNGMKFDQESFFITRHEMTKLLWEAVEDHNQSRDANGKSGYIQYELGVTCVGLSPSKKRENHISVIVKSNQSEEEKTVDGKLIVGADGIRSRVRECLKEGKNNCSFDAWDYNPKKFQLKTWKNPATGLKLKALQIPTQKFDVADSDGTKVKCSGKNFVFLRGIAKGPFDRMSLGSLPVKDSQPLRPATAITRPSHILWTLTSGEDVKLWMKDNFPRVDLDDLISNEEWERFAKARGLEFPPCQYSPALVVSGKHGDSGIVLLGDAAHSFSPDIGQGINAGLVDVVRFNETLSNFSQLGSALKEYERIQAPETRALIRIARFGAPYQYNQPLLRDKIGKFVHTTNLVLRLLLNKMTFGMFPKPMILSVTMDSDLTFRQVARRADLGTAALFSLSAAIILKILSP